MILEAPGDVCDGFVYTRNVVYPEHRVPLHYLTSIEEGFDAQQLYAVCDAGYPLRVLDSVLPRG